MNRRFTTKELSAAKEIGAETLRTHHHAALQAASRPLDGPRGRAETAFLMDNGRVCWLRASAYKQEFRESTGIAIAPEDGDSLILATTRSAEGHGKSDGPKEEPPDALRTSGMVSQAAGLAEAAAIIRDADNRREPAGGFADVILLLHGIELGLKALQRCERDHGPHDREHDLLKLFDALSDDTQEKLIRQMPGGESWPELALQAPDRRNIRAALAEARDDTVRWRYASEQSSIIGHTGELQHALDAVLHVCGYDRDWASKAPVLGNQGKPGGPSPPTP